MWEQQYRCMPCQTVYPTIDAWRAHAQEQHADAIGRAAGFCGDPPAEQGADPNSPEVLNGIRLIINQTPNVGKRGLHPDVQAAIRALVAIDADPYWYMSDAYNVYPNAKLNATGDRIARARGYIVKCRDHRDNGGACRRELLAKEHGGTSDDGRCSGCASSLSAYGPPPPIEGVPALCGMCTVTIMRETRDPNYVIPRDRSHSRYGYR